MTAQVGFLQVTDLGDDIAHMNLHKTFAILHSGVSPGVGPIGMKFHLAKYKPKHCFIDKNTDKLNAISSATVASGSILTHQLDVYYHDGTTGLKLATSCALLNY